MSGGAVCARWCIPCPSPLHLPPHCTSPAHLLTCTCNHNTTTHHHPTQWGTPTPPLPTPKTERGEISYWVVSVCWWGPTTPIFRTLHHRHVMSLSFVKLSILSNTLLS